PQVGLNVGAKLVAKEENEEENLNIGNSETDDLKPFDFGWKFLAGVELKNNLFFSVNYSLGLANLNPASDLTAKSNYFGVSLGYFFGGAKKAK
ncbi:MAG TPA: outer membrane beta-barrel protein, partial [Phnomibacter sp.]|nr:outer membrane beta-barrel protein [Phnomibacter sp.]